KRMLNPVHLQNLNKRLFRRHLHVGVLQPRVSETGHCARRLIWFWRKGATCVRAKSKAGLGPDGA
ncbi:hypothetical protein, partial [uncultured Ruegeria sp.]|uniref:hypothetical protein n=1 Tax=uncultured Ruegeria sp. TaxID=259304 RepID=UPI00262D5958